MYDGRVNMRYFIHTVSMKFLII